MPNDSPLPSQISDTKRWRCHQGHQAADHEGAGCPGNLTVEKTARGGPPMMVQGITRGVRGSGEWGVLRCSPPPSTSDTWEKPAVMMVDPNYLLDPSERYTWGAVCPSINATGSYWLLISKWVLRFLPRASVGKRWSVTYQPFSSLLKTLLDFIIEQSHLLEDLIGEAVIHYSSWWLFFVLYCLSLLSCLLQTLDAEHARCFCKCGQVVVKSSTGGAVTAPPHSYPRCLNIATMGQRHVAVILQHPVGEWRFKVNGLRVWHYDCPWPRWG